MLRKEIKVFAAALTSNFYVFASAVSHSAGTTETRRRWARGTWNLYLTTVGCSHSRRTQQKLQYECQPAALQIYIGIYWNLTKLGVLSATVQYVQLNHNSSRTHIYQLKITNPASKC